MKIHSSTWDLKDVASPSAAMESITDFSLEIGQENIENQVWQVVHMLWKDDHVFSQGCLGVMKVSFLPTKKHQGWQG